MAAMKLPMKAHEQDAFISHDTQNSTEPYLFINSLIVPRPIAFITTCGTNGIINAAPFSYFNIVSTKQVIISVSIGRNNGEHKDTARNILSKKEFVVNICSSDLAHAVGSAGKHYPPHISEIDITNLSLLPSKKISVPRIANTFVQLECILKQSIEVLDGSCDLFLGAVIHVHTHRDIMTKEGCVDMEKFNPLARVSGSTYAQLKFCFDVIQ